MLNDMFLWARDSPRCSNYEASLFLFADQFEGAGYYNDMLQRLDAIRYDLLLVTPTLDINKPETPQWPGLLMDRGAASFALETSKISEAHAAAEEEETPKKLDTHGKLLLETEDMKKPESSECPGRQIDGGSGWGSSEEPCPRKHKAGAAEETSDAADETP